MHSLDDVRAALGTGRRLTGIGISAQLDLSAHALNNEGSRNNATIPRQVDVVAGDDVVQVNAISGDTIKHSFVDYLKAAIADHPGSDGELPLCDACRQGDPNRLNAVASFQQLAKRGAKEVDNASVIRALIQHCTVDDIAGLLVTQGNRNTPRRSAIQFGWQIGIPEHVRTGRYTHVKLVPSDPSTDNLEGGNLGQNIFTKPASSGRYALVALLDLYRIGRNDLTQQLEVSDAAWRARSAAAISALFHTVAMPGGAQRNTQLPHLHGVAGALAVSLANMPPVIYSPLAEDFVEQMVRVAGAFGRAGSDHFVLPFESVGQLGALATGLAELALAR